MTTSTGGRRSTGGGPRAVRSPRPPRRLEVFAVEDVAAQLSWGRLGPGLVEVACGARRWQVEADGGPGTLVLDGLRPAAEHVVHLRGPGITPARSELRFRTLPPPPGRELARFATISDLHLGEESFGLLPRIREHPAPAVGHPFRCARAALEEALAWGAGRIVVKGDVTHESYPEHWVSAAELLGEVPVPVDVLPGNHDMGRRRTVEPAAAAARHGLHLVDGLHVVDLPGLRLVLLDSTVPDWGYGRVNRRRDDVRRALATAPGGVLVITHHNLMPLPLPHFWPPGVPSPAARRFLRALRSANPAVLVTSGHTHRHRRRERCGVVLTEVGAPKDYPGTWAGYVVHEGGIRQVVRRVADPDAIRWNERTRRSAGGLWGAWAPGRLDDRCFTHRWAPAAPGGHRR